MTRARDLAAGTFELATGGVLKLETSDTTVTDGSVLGKIEFKAPDEASGTDANLTAAAIEAVAEGTFAADNNATELVFKTGASAAADVKMTLTSGGNLGIGTSSPDKPLEVVATNTAMKISGTGVSSTGLLFETNGVERKQIGIPSGSSDLAFYSDAGSSEAMRIDSSGNLLVGKTSGSIGATGTAIYGGSNEGLIESTRDGNRAMTLNRLTSDGDIMHFRKAGTTVGSIGNRDSDDIFINTAGGTGSLSVGGTQYYAWSSGAIYPWTDNARDLGGSSNRYDDIFATNGTIQTSDANEKQDIASLTSAEMLVAKRISALFKTFRWKDKVAAKGANARTHTGIIAQDVQSAFTAESLDSGNYSLFISTTWWEHDVDVPAVEAVAEVTDEDGNVITEAVEAVDAYTRTDTYDTQSEAPEGATSKTRMGIRYPELLSFVAAYNEQRFASIETRLTALEG